MPPGVPEANGSGAVGPVAASGCSVHPPMGLRLGGVTPAGASCRVGTTKASSCTTKVGEAEQGTGEPGIKKGIKSRERECCYFFFFFEGRWDCLLQVQRKRGNPSRGES